MQCGTDGDLQYIPIDGHYVCSHRGSHSSFRVLMSCLLKTTKFSRKQTNKQKQTALLMLIFILFKFWPKTSWGAFSSHGDTHRYMHIYLCTYKTHFFFFLIQHLLSSSYMLSLWDEINFPLESLAQTQPLSLVKALFSELK